MKSLSSNRAQSMSSFERCSASQFIMQMNLKTKLYQFLNTVLTVGTQWQWRMDTMMKRTEDIHVSLTV